MPARHIPALDGLRGVAVLMVLLTHVAQGWNGALSIYLDTTGLPRTFELPYVLHAVTRACDHGVQLFFVLSAFTLAMQGDRVTGDLAGYGLRRLAKIGPSYWLAGLLYLALAGPGPRLWAPHGVGAGDVAAAGLFASGFQGGAALAVVPGGWSVCCEALFYLVLPFVLRGDGGGDGGGGGGVRRALRWTCGSFVVAAAWVLLGGKSGPFDPVLQMPVFMFGVLAAAHHRAGGAAARGWTGMALLAFAILLLPLVPGGAGTFLGQTVFAACCAIAIPSMAAAPVRLLEHPALRFMGRISYGMYLVHFLLLAPCLALAEHIAPSDGPLTMAVAFLLVLAGTTFLALVLFEAIEQPITRWAARRRTRPRPAAPALQA